MDTQLIKEYYQKITDIDIGLVARELMGGRITSEHDGTLFIDCPHHASDTKKSLHVNITKQKWYCFGCGIGGDVLHLVEFVQSGAVTKAPNGSMPDTHRRARDFLAEKCSLPPLTGYGMSGGDLSEIEKEHFKNCRALDCLTDIVRWYHERLRENTEAYRWFAEKYRLSDEIISAQRIGWADNRGLPQHLRAKGYTNDEIESTGAFYFDDRQNEVIARFFHRIILPYWTAGGRVDYLIGRFTPWTDEKEKDVKYKKLPVHNEATHQRVSPAINNAHLHNEHVLLGQSDYVVFCEGITDNLSAIDHGLPAISPVTVSVRNADWPRLIPKLSRIKTAYIVGDNEVSKAGLEGSLKIATILRKHNIDARIVILPLSEEQQQARQLIADRWGITDAHDKNAVAAKKKMLSDGEREEYDALCQLAKADLNSFFADGHTREEFDALMAQAVTPIDFAVSRLDPSGDVPSQLDTILREACEYPAVLQKQITKAIKAKIGKEAGLSLADIQAQLRDVKQEVVNGRRAAVRKAKYQVTAPPGTCRNVIETTIRDLAPDTDNKDVLYSAAAEAAFKWFSDNGARFFRTTLGDPFMLWANNLYWMKSGDHGKKSLYGSMIYDYTGLTGTTIAGRVFMDVLCHRAVQHGEVRDRFSWLYTDIRNQTVWFNLNNADHELAKISPAGVEIVANGGNEDGVFLAASEKLEPVKYIPDIDDETAMSLISQHFLRHLACSPDDKLLILLWMCCFLLLDYSSTKPMARFEGPSGSGKSTAAKLISVLILGDEQQKRSTVAANYADGERTPFLLLDNVEVAQMTEDLLGFFLITVTGAVNEKRAQGTDSGTVQEKPKCLICSTGIAPLAGEFTEVTSRSFVINFDPTVQSPDFVEADVKTALRDHRDYLLSWIMQKTAKVLEVIKHNGQRQIKCLLTEEFPNHAQRRCNEYLSLMYAYSNVGLTSEITSNTQWMHELSDDFAQLINKVGKNTEDVNRDSNPILAGLSTLFKAYGRIANSGDFAGNAVKEFEDKFLLKFSHDGRLVNVPLSDLHRALTNIAYQYRLPWPYKNSRQLSQRLKNDIRTIEEGGFSVTWKTGGGRVQYFTIEPIEREDNAL